MLVDEFVPLNPDGVNRFGSSSNGSLWPALLEKASAKVYGGYWNIVGGSVEQALKDLTAAPCETFYRKDISPILVINRLVESYNKQFIVVVSTEKEEKNLEKNSGLVPEHAYLLTGIFKLNNETVFKLRNPHGKVEKWGGDWSEHSKKWTDKFKKQAGF